MRASGDEWRRETDEVPIWVEPAPPAAESADAVDPEELLDVLGDRVGQPPDLPDVPRVVRESVRG
jgi:hypothetical protein